MAKENIPDRKIELTEQQEKFCELYVFGGAGFAGQHCNCYREVFGEDRKNIAVASRRLLTKPEIAARIREMSGCLQSETEAIAIKLQVTETLRSVMEETATSSFTDKFGVSLSPAPLRAVSVNAAKALMELYPIKNSQDKTKIEAGEGGIVFNVIVPDNTVKHEKKDEPE